MLTLQLEVILRVQPLLIVPTAFSLPVPFLPFLLLLDGYLLPCCVLCTFAVHCCLCHDDALHLPQVLPG